MKGAGKKPNKLYMKLANELAVALYSGSTLVSMIPITIGRSNAPLHRVTQKSRRAVIIWFSITIKNDAIDIENPIKSANVSVVVAWYPPNLSVISALMIAPVIGPVIETIPK